MSAPNTEPTYVRGSRDPFSRTELWKRREVNAECAWCGAIDPKRTVFNWESPSTNRPVARVYRFEVQSDGGRVFPDRKTFCSRACREAYGG